MGLLVIPARDTASEIPPESPRMAMVGENSLIGISSHAIEERPPYADLIARLCDCESGSDPTKIHHDDGGSDSIGILQFKVPTYYRFCMVKYGMNGDITNPENQIDCAEKMLEENFNNVWNWTNCWKLIR